MILFKAYIFNITLLTFSCNNFPVILAILAIHL